MCVTITFFSIIVKQTQRKHLLAAHRIVNKQIDMLFNVKQETVKEEAADITNEDKQSETT